MSDLSKWLDDTLAGIDLQEETALVLLKSDIEANSIDILKPFIDNQIFTKDLLKKKSLRVYLPTRSILLVAIHDQTQVNEVRAAGA